MTLGGLALAVGVLVDEATVEIENIHTPSGRRHVASARGASRRARRRSLPRLLSMLCVLAVFIPSLFMAGVGRQLFVPLSLAVGFAMISSYVLSSTLVPVLATWMLRPGHQRGAAASSSGCGRPIDSGSTRSLRLRWALVRALSRRGAGVHRLALPANRAPRSSRPSKPASFSSGCARRRARGSNGPSRSR